MTGSEFMAQFGSRTDLLETIGSFLQNAEVTLSPADQRYLRNLYYTINKERLDSESKTRKHQEGGILFAADGTSLFTNAPRDVNNWHTKFDKTKQLAKEDQDIEKAKAEGYKNAEHYRANKSTDLGLTDYMRFATMAQDAASIVASFVPGAGTGVAAGLGVTSMGTDLVADILDPAVSAGEVVKNLGMNAAFAGMGLIPGAKMGKVAKNIVKYAPKIMTAAAGLGIAMDESTQATFKKIGDGSVKFNREDWRNISHVLSLLAGATRGVRQSAANRKVKNSIVASDNVKLKGVKTADGKDFELPKQTVKDINAELAKANTPDDIKAIQQKYNNLPDEAIDAPMIKEGKLAGKYKLVGTETTADANKTYDSMRELWNVDAKALKAQSKTTLGKAAIRFANRFGGGAYGANQRAMLSEGLGKVNNMKYDNYNPLVDWKSLRTRSGLEVIPERVKPAPVKTAPLADDAVPSQGAENVDLRKYTYLRSKLNPWGQQKPYNGVDEVADGIHVNPTRNEAPIKGTDEVRRVSPKVELSQKPLSKFTGRDFAKALTDPDVFFKVKEGLAGEIKELKKLEKTTKSIPQ
jgi:macrodomain Ter protein organizer (MatP/YcbG family)